MKTTGGEMLKVDPTPIDDAGNKLEPEERTATEIVSMPIEVSVADHAVRPDLATPVGTMPGMMSDQKSAGEVAQNTATRCELCEHWRQEDYRRHLAILEGTSEGERQITAFRNQLLGLAIEAGEVEAAKIDPDDYVRATLAMKHEFAICAAFTESTGMISVTPFYGGCPIDDSRFKMRDASSRRLASAGYDKILRLAQGRSE